MKKAKIILRKNIVLILLFALVCPALTVEAKQQSKKNDDVKTIVIDPQCQAKYDGKKEPVGPGAFETKLETSAGYVGKETGYPEYELNLQIALKVQEQLADQGYNVLLTRSTNDVNIPNSGRAMIANTAKADVFVVINTKKESGVSVYCQSDDNPYNYGQYQNCRLLSDALLGSVIQATGSTNNGVTETDDQIVINWCAAPTAIVGVGSLVDADDEAKLVTDEYQEEMAKGIANGIESYFAQK